MNEGHEEPGSGREKNGMRSSPTRSGLRPLGSAFVSSCLRGSTDLSRHPYSGRIDRKPTASPMRLHSGRMLPGRRDHSCRRRPSNLSASGTPAGVRRASRHRIRRCRSARPLLCRGAVPQHAGPLRAGAERDRRQDLLARFAIPRSAPPTSTHNFGMHGLRELLSEARFTGTRSHRIRWPRGYRPRAFPRTASRP
jgi:hypothetical protein